MPLSKANVTLARMGRKLACAALTLVACASRGHAFAPIYDPVKLNIGISCQWQLSCERRQLAAMSQAHSFIAHQHPPLWRIHLCNRNARRAPTRLDWVGFNDCIRNRKLRRPPQRRR